MFILVGLVSSIPVFANPVKTVEKQDDGTFVLDMQNNKAIALNRTYIVRNSNHSYRLSVRQGETASFTVHSSKPVSIKVSNAAGVIEQGKTGTTCRVVLSGAGDFVIEISSADIAYYTLDVKTK